MRNNRAIIIILSCAIALCGCSTIRNIIEGPSIYGGVSTAIDKPISNEIIPFGTCSDPVLLIIILPIISIDTACSAILDTAILPFTVPYELLCK